MRLPISRARYDRVRMGMSPIDRERFAELVDVHDGEPAQAHIDVRRVRDRFAELAAEPPPPRPANLSVTPSASDIYQLWHAAMRAEKTEPARGRWVKQTDSAVFEADFPLLPSSNEPELEQKQDTEYLRQRYWQQLVGTWDNVGYIDDGNVIGEVWLAPPGTPEPLFTPPPRPPGWPKDGKVSQAYMEQLYEHDPDRPADAYGSAPWLSVDDVTREINTEPTNAFRRDRLGVWVEGRPPPRRELRVGHRALEAIHAVRSGRSARDRVGDVPIVLDHDLPASAWRLVDVESGDVMFEGCFPADPADLVQTVQLQTRPPDPFARASREIVDEHLREYVAAVREAVDDLADKTEVPRDMLY